jgi:Rod binding domain-containing protein
MDPIQGASAATPKPSSQMTPAEQRRLVSSAKEIESMFLQNLLKSMRQASGTKGPLSGQGQRVYQELMDEHLGRALAKGGGIGLADLLVRDVLRRQGVMKNPSSRPADVPMGPTGGVQ